MSLAKIELWQFLKSNSMNYGIMAKSELWQLFDKSSMSYSTNSRRDCRQ